MEKHCSKFFCIVLYSEVEENADCNIFGELLSLPFKTKKAAILNKLQLF